MQLTAAGRICLQLRHFLMTHQDQLVLQPKQSTQMEADVWMINAINLLKVQILEVYCEIERLSYQLDAFIEDAAYAAAQAAKTEPEDLKPTRRSTYSPHVIATLENWLYANRENPYPSAHSKLLLRKQTQLTQKQIEQWFVNRRRKSRARGSAAAAVRNPAQASSFQKTNQTSSFQKSSSTEQNT